MTLTDVSPGAHRVRLSMGCDPTNPTEFIHRPVESQSPLHRIILINEIRNLTFEQPANSPFSSRSTTNRCWQPA
ncbi:MAG: hypothetical protein ABSG50_12200 [Opitutaceae bacterium]|jgi:hypothetical protein